MAWTSPRATSTECLLLNQKTSVASERRQTVRIDASAPSLNKFYAGVHWTERNSIKNTWRTLVKKAVRDDGIKPIEHYPIEVEVILNFGKGDRRYDWENGSMAAKLVQDSLISEGILTNDSPPYISKGSIACVKNGSTSYVEYTLIETIPE